MDAKEGLSPFTHTHLASILCPAVVVERVESVDRTGSISTVYFARASGREGQLSGLYPGGLGPCFKVLDEQMPA